MNFPRELIWTYKLYKPTNRQINQSSCMSSISHEQTKSRLSIWTLRSSAPSWNSPDSHRTRSVPSAHGTKTNQIGNLFRQMFQKNWRKSNKKVISLFWPIRGAFQRHDFNLNSGHTCTMSHGPWLILRSIGIHGSNPVDSGKFAKPRTVPELESLELIWVDRSLDT